MADSRQPEPTMSGGSSSIPQEPTQLPAEAATSTSTSDGVELKPIDAVAAAENTEAGPQTPAKDTAGDAKGKQKDESAIQPGKDSLSIDRTDAATAGPEDPLSSSPLDTPAGAAAVGPDGGPVCNITLLLPTGARHPYRIDEKYLAKRSVDVPELNEAGKKDPFSMSVYKLKELILREWRDEWDGKPASPSSIRLIHFGKLLDDKEQLKKYQFSAEAPNVVHMSVRPAEMMEEDEAAKGKTSGRDSRNREGGGGCCVIL